MKGPNDIIIYNRLTQQNGLYQFLGGIDEPFDKDRRDLLLQDPLSTVEEAYASIRREKMRRGIRKKEPSSDLDSLGIEGGLSVKGKTYRKDDDKSHLRCTHCGGTGHTKSECFKLVGYPEWWPNAKKNGTRGTTKISNNRTGRVAIGLSIDGHVSLKKSDLSPSFSNALSIFRGGWIFDCGATDTMSYDPNDFVTHDKQIKILLKLLTGKELKWKEP